jgi:hypothetical protein
MLTLCYMSHCRSQHQKSAVGTASGHDNGCRECDIYNKSAVKAAHCRLSDIQACGSVSLFLVWPDC